MTQLKSKKKLLIIEDDPANLKFLQMYLNRYFEVTICDSDTAFYEKIENEIYDLILMDISIRGEKNGLELTRELKSDPKYSLIPVICYTAHALQKDRINAMDAGCDLFLNKPVNNAYLVRELKKFLDKRDLAIDNDS
ncbi:response regulator [Bacteroidota bacterium]